METTSTEHDPVTLTKELLKVNRQIAKVDAIGVQLRLRRAELLRELGGA